MSTLKVTVKETTTNNKTSWQGSYQLPGSTVAKLATTDGETRFENRAGLNRTARKVAATLGWELQYEEPALKAAAKKSLKTKAPTSCKSKCDGNVGSTPA